MGDKEALGVGLADAIATVRRELEHAIAEGEMSALAFRAGPVEMEFAVSFSQTGSANTGLRAWVVTVGAKGELSSAATHRLKFSLIPVRRSDGAEQIIGDVGAR